MPQQLLLNDPSRSDQLNTGVVANDGTGDPERNAWLKLALWAVDANAMFKDAYGQLSYVLNPSGDASGTTDAANFTAFEAAAAAAIVLPSGFSDKAGNLCLTLGAGDFYINASGAMLGNGGLSQKASGITFRGLGPNLTRIHYIPTNPGPMCVNKYWQNVLFENMTIYGGSATSDFLQMLEQGGVSNIQDTRFRNVKWIGAWQHLHLATGGNNNSEVSWDRCTVDGAVVDWLCIPQNQTATFTAANGTIALTNTTATFVVGSTITFSATVGNIATGTTYFIVAASSTGISISATSGGAVLTPNTNGTATATVGSDQFVNYWWRNCKFWDAVNGMWINAYFGGHFAIEDCDVSNHAPTVQTYLFNLMFNVHAQGVCSFRIRGLRVEHSSNNSLLLQSQWPQGNISVEQYDGSSQVGSRPTTQQYISIAPVNIAGPTVSFRDCSLPGQHAYPYTANNYNFQIAATYDNCVLLQNYSASAFIAQSGVNVGGAALIRFRNCKNGNNAATVGYHEVVDCDLNWQQHCGAASSAKVVNLVGANGDAPISAGTITFRLPVNVWITRLRFLKQADASTGAYNYTVKTTEAVPTTLATFTGTSSGSASYQTDALTSPFYATTDLQRTIVLTDAQNRVNPFTNYQLLVEYQG